jgi:hypothetical protein
MADNQTRANCRRRLHDYIGLDLFSRRKQDGMDLRVMWNGAVAALDQTRTQATSPIN